MAFQDNTFSMPSHLYIYFHILFLTMITLQMKSLMMKGLNRDWNWVLHPPGVVWYDWLSGWLADRRTVVKSELAYFGERQERTCHVSSADLETQKKSKGEGEKWAIKNVRGIAILLHALCVSIHAWLPYSLRSMRVSFVVFTVSQFSVFMCQGTDKLLTLLVRSWFLAWVLLDWVWICLWLFWEKLLSYTETPSATIIE